MSTIRDAILTCAQKPTRVSLVYRTELTTKKLKTEKLKSKKNRYAQKCQQTVQEIQSWRREERLRWEGFAENGVFNGITMNNLPKVVTQNGDRTRDLMNKSDALPLHHQIFNKIV